MTCDKPLMKPECLLVLWQGGIKKLKGEIDFLMAVFCCEIPMSESGKLSDIGDSDMEGFDVGRQL